MFKNFCIAISTCFGIGFMSKAPGTFGSLPGLAFGAFLSFSAFKLEGEVFVCQGNTALLLNFLAILAVSVLAYFCVTVTEKHWVRHDDGRIVIDEFIGQAIVIAFIAPTTTNLILGFVLFRLFDIWKPGPIGWADKSLKGAFGVILDDVFAGVFALLVLMGVSRTLEMYLSLAQ